MHTPRRPLAAATAAIPALTLALAIAPAPAPAEPHAKLPEATERIPGSDSYIEGRLITAFTLNEHLNFSDIQVTSDKGRVTLTGSVPTQLQRQLAEHLAHELVAVRSIDNQLEVHPDRRSEGGNALYRLVQDAKTTTRITLQLTWSSATGADDITAYTDDGRVRLTGTVASEAERKAAERIALRTSGVRAVTNDIEVESDGDGPASQPGQSAAAAGQLADGRITERAAATLRFARGVKDGNIEVSTEDGVVSLTGTVRADAQKQQATDIVRGLAGVREVKNELAVTQQTSRPGPDVSRPTPRRQAAGGNGEKQRCAGAMSPRLTGA